MIQETTAPSTRLAERQEVFEHAEDGTRPSYSLVFHETRQDWRLRTGSPSLLTLNGFNFQLADLNYYGKLLCSEQFYLLS